MKKLIVCLIAFILAFVLVACGNSPEKTSEESTSTATATSTSSATSDAPTAAATTTEAYEEEETQPQYNHSAIQGCVIEEQDGSDMVKYREKCESCGYVSSSTHIIHHTFGTYNSSFTCPQCSNVQKVEIESHEN